jgi:hypothetical protein
VGEFRGCDIVWVDLRAFNRTKRACDFLVMEWKPSIPHVKAQIPSISGFSDRLSALSPAKISILWLKKVLSIWNQTENR